MSCTVCEEYVVSVLSDLQHRRFHALVLTYLDKVICDTITQATDSLPQQLCCSFIQQLKLSSRGVARKNKDAIQVSLRNPPYVINALAFKISVKN